MKLDERIPVEIRFGVGEINRLHEQLPPGKRALIVFGGVAKQLETVQAELAKVNITGIIFKSTLAHPQKEQAARAAQLAKAEGCDFILGLGDEGCIDLSKAAALLCTNEGDLWDYVSGGSGAGKKTVHPMLPLVAIPITAGSGAAISSVFAITNEKAGETALFDVPGLYPAIAVVDPQFMCASPQAQLIYSAMDGYFYCLAVLIANRGADIWERFAQKGTALIKEYLPRAMQNGSDLEARAQLAMGSLLGGLCRSMSACAPIQAISYSISTVFPNVSYVCALLIITESYYRFLFGKIPDQLKNAAMAMGETSVIDAFTAFMKRYGVYNISMRQYGISIEDIPNIAKNAMYTMPLLFKNETYCITKDEVIAILTAAYR